MTEIFNPEPLEPLSIEDQLLLGAMYLDDIKKSKERRHNYNNQGGVNKNGETISEEFQRFVKEKSKETLGLD